MMKIATWLILLRFSFQALLHLLARQTVLGVLRRAWLDQVIDRIPEPILEALRNAANRRLFLLLHEDRYPNAAAGAVEDGVVAEQVVAR